MFTIECPYCHNHVHPRLWHYSPWYGFITYMKAQHLCNVCGAVMYETGGGLRWGRAFFCALCIAPLTYVILSLAGYGAIGQGILTLAFAIPQLVLLYLLYRLIRRFLNKFKRSSSTPQYCETTPVQTPQFDSNSLSGIEAIEKLVAFKDRGLLTPEEFEKEKKRILGK